MSTTPRSPAAQEGPTPFRATAASLRDGDLAGLGHLLGDVAHCLADLAAEPGELFTPEAPTTAAEAGSRTLVHLLAVQQDLRAALHVLEARTVVALETQTRREVETRARDEAAHEQAALPSPTALDDRAAAIARRDLSLISRRSPAHAGRALAVAHRLVEEMPQVRTALAHHLLSPEVATVLATATATVTSAQRREVDAVLGERLPYLDGAGLRDWRDEAHGIIAGLDPEGATLRHRRARRTRSVTLTPGADGMARFSALLPAVDAHLVHKRLSLEVERRRADGASDGHVAIMADSLVDTVLGREGAMEQVELDVGVVITDRALLLPDSGDPARIAGYGAVPPEAIREQLRACLTPPAPSSVDRPVADPLGADGPAVRAVLRRLYTHPTSGELVAVESQGRAFPAALGRFLTWRDTSCRGPFCNAAARQHDHVHPHARGGPTSASNGQELCAHCNGKEQQLARVETMDAAAEHADPPGGTAQQSPPEGRRPSVEHGPSAHRVAWTGHSGVTRVTGPRPLVRPLPPERAPSVSASPGSSTQGRLRAHLRRRRRLPAPAHPLGVALERLLAGHRPPRG